MNLAKGVASFFTNQTLKPLQQAIKTVGNTINQTDQEDDSAQAAEDARNEIDEQAALEVQNIMSLSKDEQEHLDQLFKRTMAKIEQRLQNEKSQV